MISRTKDMFKKWNTVYFVQLNRASFPMMIDCAELNSPLLKRCIALWVQEIILYSHYDSRAEKQKNILLCYQNFEKKYFTENLIFLEAGDS